MRETTQRRLVCEVFFRRPGHHSVDELFVLVHKRDPRIGYATVYRTLRLLVNNGLAAERKFGDSPTRFEVREIGRHHDHLICLDCDEIVEFEDPEIERRQVELAQELGFSLVKHKHELYGRCEACQRRGASGEEPFS